uniref:Uncharacterized protein n=1 Tax=Panagrolaimus sp. ES5 TaxID=591445 RepID=A0AC34FC04_9BILA
MVEEAAKTYNEKYSALKLDEIENVQEKIKVLESFSSKHLLLPEAWIIRIQLEVANNEPYETIKALLKRALFDFYSEAVLQSVPDNFRIRFIQEEKPFERLVNWPGNVEIYTRNCFFMNDNYEKDLIDALKFPNIFLHEIYFLLVEFSGKEISNAVKETCWKNQKKYEKIEASNNNIRKWITNILGVNDFGFFIQNVEARIAREPMNIELWQIYIGYLQEVHGNVSIFEIIVRARNRNLDVCFFT